MLELLLSFVGASALLDAMGEELIALLVKGIGDSGNNTGAITVLLGKLL